MNLHDECTQIKKKHFSHKRKIEYNVVEKLTKMYVLKFSSSCSFSFRYLRHLASSMQYFMYGSNLDSNYRYKEKTNFEHPIDSKRNLDIYWRFISFAVSIEIIGTSMTAMPTTTAKSNSKYNNCTLECIKLSTYTELSLKRPVLEFSGQP